jgi:hypothetical protein
MSIEATIYYEEFLRYYSMAKTQQQECNLGIIPHAESSVNDNLMKNIHLYDVVNRKYAGFSQILLDMRYGNDFNHPYFKKFHNVRLPICKAFNKQSWDTKEWFYVFLLHRVTGSGINYAKNPSGYHNTILPEFHDCATVEEMVSKVRQYKGAMYTSVGYQFPAFPKPISSYKRGGDYFLCEYAPKLINKFIEWLVPNTSFRDAMDFLVKWNKDHGLRAYRFQYAAFLADIADFYPLLIDSKSLFFYGTNARECIKYMAKPKTRMNEQDFLDRVTEKACEDTGGVPYDIEDVMCDSIRWIENYIKPGKDYNHICRDSTWNSSKIKNHPFGRQKAMLDLGLIKSFNNLNVHPSDNYILKINQINILDYKIKCLHL